MTKSLEQFFCWSLSVGHGDPAELREDVSLESHELEQLMTKLLYVNGLDLEQDRSAMFLQTCHRVELYGFGMAPDIARREWMGPRVGGDVQGLGHLFVGADAFRHLIRVCSSLDSEVLGETQITGQVKDVVRFSQESRWLRGTLDRIVQRALAGAKRVRHESQVSHGAVSVAHVAVDGAQDLFESFEKHQALVLGAGSMALQAIERLEKLQFQRILWANRSFETMLKRPVSSRVSLQSWDDRHSLAWTVSVVVAATSAREPILDRATLAKLRCPVGRTDLRLILDLGLPRNVEDSIHGFDGFYVRNVDEFKDRAAQNSQERRKAVGKAEALVEEEVKAFVSSWNNWDRGPLVAELIQSLNQAREMECLEVPVEDRAKMEYKLRSVQGKFVHRLLEELDRSDETLSLKVLETIARAWRHPEEWLQRRRNPLQKLNRP